MRTRAKRYQADSGITLRVLNTTRAYLRDDMSPAGEAVAVVLEQGHELQPKNITWLLGGTLMVEMHSSLTLSMPGENVQVLRSGKQSSKNNQEGEA